MKEYKFTIGGRQYSVAVNGIEGKTADVTVNGTNYKVEMENAPAAPSAPSPASAAVAPAQQTPAPAAASASGSKTITSPLPGVIISVDVRIGQEVKRGQKVAVLEAMKMENEILASSDGTVKDILVHKGDSVLEGADIVIIG